MYPTYRISTALRRHPTNVKLSTLFVLMVALCADASKIAVRHAAGAQSLRIVPQEIRMWGGGATQRFVVLFTSADGLERDVTSQVRSTVSDLQLVRVVDPGRLVALANGSLDLRVEIDDQIAEAKIFIKGSAIERSISFSRDIVAIFTQRGCNTSDCHGGVKGSGGFKLSLGGVSPQEDHHWIVNGGVYQVLSAQPGTPIKPRISPAQPAESLLLQKPTLAVQHEGGKLFEKGSTDYSMILDWVRNGAPYKQEGDGTNRPTIQRVEVFPTERVIDLQGEHRLLVTAYLSNGHCEDISEHVRYQSSNPKVLTVTTDGLVKAVKSGEAVVLIQAPRRTMHARFGVVDTPISNYPDLSSRNFIDQHVFAKLRRFHIVPAELSSDAEFLRRACLDVTGTLPLPEQVREFLASEDSNKRDSLIELMLDSPEYVDYWTFRFADFFRVHYRNVSRYKDWIRNSLARNKPYDQMARERVASQGNFGPIGHYIKSVSGEMLLPEEMMSEDVRLFLGLRLECAQCHNHPFEAWTQDQFWGLAAFYGQLSRVRDLGVYFDDEHGNGERTDGPRVLHPRHNVEAELRFLDGTSPENIGAEPRMRLAEWITSPANPYFSKAIVNRIWSHFFGRGIVDPVDDVRDTNPPTHPDLLEALALDLEQHSYDVKHLMRMILQSRTYQASGNANETNEDDRINYSRALPRRLDAEILLDAITRVTGVEEEFAVHEYVGGGVEPAGTRAIDLVPEVSPSQFLDVFGRPPVRDAMPFRDHRPTLNQALHMLAGSTFVSKIAQGEGRAKRLLKSDATDQDIVQEFYLAAFSRFPTSRELEELELLFDEASSRSKAITDLVWALIASREFTYNH